VAVTLSLTRGAANLLKAVILNSSWGVDCETDTHYVVIVFPLPSDKQIINYYCRVPVMHQLAVLPDREQTASRWQF